MFYRIEGEFLDKIKSTFDLTLLWFVYIFLIICDDSFSNGLSNGIYLSDITRSSNSHSDVKILESLKSEKENRLHDFDSQRLRFKKFDGWTIDSEYTFACSYSSNSNCIFLFSKALNELAFCLRHDWLVIINWILF